MYSTELSQWVQQATHPTVLMADGRAFIGNPSCYQLLNLQQSTPILLRHIEAALPGFQAGYESASDHWQILDPTTAQVYQVVRRAYWETDAAEYSLIVIEFVPLAWSGAPVGFNGGWLSATAHTENVQSLLVNLDSNALSLSTACAQRLGIDKLGHLDALLAQLHPVDQSVLQARITLFKDEPWRSPETLFVKMKTEESDTYADWQIVLRKAPPVQADEPWLALTLSKAKSATSAHKSIEQPVRGKVGAGSLLVIQLMDYRDFIDSYGAEQAAALSEQLLSILTGRMTHDDYAWRLSDDHFVAWFPGDTRGKRSDECWCASLKKLEAPIMVGELVYRARIRAGRARAVNPESRAEQLIERAMSGLSEARVGQLYQAGKSTDENHAKLKAKRQRQTQLLKDFDEGRYRMIYQPITPAHNVKEAIGVEALSRSVSATGELFSGGDIVEAAQRLDFVREWTEWGLAQIQEDLTGWLKESPERFVTFNVMPHLLRSDSSVTWLIDTLSRIPESFCQRMAIEITEQMIGGPLSLEGLAAIRTLGIDLYLDDFGAGESNLYRLVDIQPDAIKLDRFLIELMLDDQPRQDTLEKLVSLARSISPKIIAEGIERPEQLQLVQALGVDWVQGYLIGRQLSLSDEAILGQFQAEF